MAKILVVDDSLFQRMSLSKAVRQSGYEALAAENGDMGLHLMKSEAPDAVLLDLNMPELGGFDVLERMRESGTAIPVVILTADIQESSRRRCMDLGAKAILNKPVDENELKAVLESVISGG